MNIIYFTTLVAFFEIIFGLYLIIKKNETIVHVSFAIFCIVLGLWTALFGIFSNKIIQDQRILRYLVNFMYLGGVSITISFLMFASVFPKNENLSVWKKTFLISQVIIFIILLFFTNLIVKGVNPLFENLSESIEFSFVGNLLYSLLFAINICWGSIILVKKYKSAKGRERQQIFHFSLGLFLTFGLGASVAVFLPFLGIKNFIKYAAFFTIPYILMTSYSIFRYRLLDIEIVIKRTTLYLIVVALITGIYSVIILVVPYTVLGTPPKPLSVLLMVIGALIIAGTIGPLQQWIERVTNRFFFQRRYDYYLVLERISKELSAVVKMEDVVNAVVRPLVHEMHLKTAAIYIRDKVDGPFICHKKFGELADEIPELAEEGNVLIDYLIDRKTIIETGEFRHEYGHLYPDEQHIMDKRKAKIQHELDVTFQAGLIVPLLLKKNLIGFLLLGEKRSGDQFTYRDLALLETLANQMSTALENTKLYEQMLHTERLTLIGTMSASIAHEIRNPLASIKTFIQMLPEKFDKAEFRQTFQNIVPLEIERISGITADLLNFAKPSPPNLESVDIANTIERVVALLNNKLRKGQIQVEKKWANLPLIQADAQQLSQVFLNLILNSIQATTKPSTITVTAMVKQAKWASPQNSPQFLEVVVEDQGMGVKLKDISKLFQPFYTTKTEGTGLGLATCKRIIDAHRGEIMFESEEGKGATVTIRLPLGLTDNDIQAKQQAPMKEI